MAAELYDIMEMYDMQNVKYGCTFNNRHIPYKANVESGVVSFYMLSIKETTKLTHPTYESNVIPKLY